MPDGHTYLKTHKISGKQLHFRLTEEQETLLQRAKVATSGRTAKTLVKDGPLRITLVAMRKGARMAKHHVDGQTSIDVLRGKLTIDTERAATGTLRAAMCLFSMRQWSTMRQHELTARS
jgi:hypothetical protein